MERIMIRVVYESIGIIVHPPDFEQFSYIPIYAKAIIENTLLNTLKYRKF